MFCKQCGSKMDVDAQFCKSCGYKTNRNLESYSISVTPTEFSFNQNTGNHLVYVHEKKRTDFRIKKYYQRQHKKMLIGTVIGIFIISVLSVLVVTYIVRNRMPDKDTVAKAIDDYLNPFLIAKEQSQPDSILPNELIKIVIDHNQIKVTKISRQDENFLAECQVNSLNTSETLRQYFMQLSASETISYDQLVSEVAAKLKQANRTDVVLNVQFQIENGKIHPVVTESLMDAYYGGLISFANEYMDKNHTRSN